MYFDFYQIREIIKEIHTREVIRENVDKDAINAVSINAKCTIDYFTRVLNSMIIPICIKLREYKLANTKFLSLFYFHLHLSVK